MSEKGNTYSTENFTLKFYPAKGNEKKPFALICPGGGYEIVADWVEGEPFAKKLNSLGYSSFVLYYRVGFAAKYPAPLDDLAGALSYILKNAEKYNVFTEGYSLWGSSAGGHLAALFASKRFCRDKYNLPQPSALVLIYPVITMGKLSHKGSVKMLLGENPENEEIKAASVENNVDANYPPTFLWNSKTDKSVNPENGVIMKNALDNFGIDNCFMQFETGEHGAGLGEGTECEAWFESAVKFWKKHTEDIK